MQPRANQRRLAFLLTFAACGPGGAEGDASEGFDADLECPDIVDVEMSTSGTQTCALGSKGRVRCWGSIGAFDPNSVGDDEPAWRAPWLEFEVVTLSVGSDVCGVTSNGLLGCRDPAQAFAWDVQTGLIVSGIFDLGALALAVSVGDPGACALLDDGSLRCWGKAVVVGVETQAQQTGDDEAPAVPELPSPATRVSVGTSTACAVLSTGDVACWGDGGECFEDFPCGALGVPGVQQSAVPLLVDLPLAVADVSVGNYAACARFTDGSFTCWGAANSVGRGGVGGNIGDDESPGSLAPLAFDEPVEEVDVGRVGGCVRLEGGSVRCWGPTLIADPLDWGNDVRLDALTAEPLPLPEAALAITVGSSNACALGESGAVYCWGTPADGALGYGHEHVIGLDPTITEVQPVPVLDPRCDQ